jgi:hypothetical protein
MTMTAVWCEVRGETVQHLRQIDSAVTLCGLGAEHTRNFLADEFVPGHRVALVHCVTCRQAVTR